MTLAVNLVRAVLGAALVVLGSLELFEIVPTISKDLTKNGRN